MTCLRSHPELKVRSQKLEPGLLDLKSKLFICSAGGHLGQEGRKHMGARDCVSTTGGLDPQLWEWLRRPAPDP